MALTPDGDGTILCSNCGTRLAHVEHHEPEGDALRLHPSLVPLPRAGTGLYRFGLPQRARRGRRPFRRQPPTGGLLGYAGKFGYVFDPQTGRGQIDRGLIFLPAEAAIYCPACGKSWEIRAVRCPGCLRSLKQAQQEIQKIREARYEDHSIVLKDAPLDDD